MGTELITTAKYDVETARTATAAWQAELGDLGIAPTFPRLKVPAGGGLQFADPASPDPESPDFVKEFTGVIVGKRKTSRLYLVPFDQRAAEDSGRPDAWSIDGKTQIVPQATYDKIKALNEERAAQNIAPLPAPSRNLAACPYNQFGSAALLGGRGKGKATNDYIELYLFTGNGFPTLLAAPAGSIQKVIQHLQNLVQQTGTVVGAETVIGLKKEKSGQGIDYSQLTFGVGGKLDADAVGKMKGYEAELAPVLAIDPFGDSEAAEELSYDFDAPATAEWETAEEPSYEHEPVAVAAGVGDIDL